MQNGCLSLKDLMFGIERFASHPLEWRLFLLLLFVPLTLIRFVGPATWLATVAIYMAICILYATAYDRKLKK